MDPNATHQEIMQLSQAAMHDASRGHFDHEAYLRLAELTLTLDGWIADGGFLPDGWQQERHVSEKLINEAILAGQASADRHHNALLRELVRSAGSHEHDGPSLDRSEVRALLKMLDRAPGAEVVEQSKPGSVPAAD